MEPCDLLVIDKLQSMYIMSKELQDTVFKHRLEFLWQIDLFQGINRNHLLPLITNLEVKMFKKGEYIQREGHEPECLVIIKDGSAIVCQEKLAMRRIPKRDSFSKGGFDDKTIETW